MWRGGGGGEEKEKEKEEEEEEKKSRSRRRKRRESKKKKGNKRWNFEKYLERKNKIQCDKNLGVSGGGEIMVTFFEPLTYEMIYQSNLLIPRFISFTNLQYSE